MAKKPSYVAVSRIEHGVVVDGKNTVKVFEAGEGVDLAQEFLAPLLAAKAIEPGNAGSTSGDEASAGAKA